jgi:transcription antitermination factor NusG
MYNGIHNLEQRAWLPFLGDEPCWFAVQTRPRHEKKVIAELAFKGITNFLPLAKETHRWSDRRKTVEVPLFPGYAFVNLQPSPESRQAVLRVPGVLNFVGAQNHGLPIPDSQIDDVRRLLASELSFSEFPFLKIGQRVVIRGGALDGMEGTLAGHNGSRRLIVSIEAIQRSLSISIEGYDVKPV